MQSLGQPADNIFQVSASGFSSLPIHVPPIKTTAALRFSACLKQFLGIFFLPVLFYRPPSFKRRSTEGFSRVEARIFHPCTLADQPAGRWRNETGLWGVPKRTVQTGVDSGGPDDPRAWRAAKHISSPLLRPEPNSKSAPPTAVYFPELLPSRLPA